VATLVRRKFSAELLDRLVGPFISGIYAGDPERLSLRSAFPQMYEAEKSAGSVLRGMIRAAKSKNEAQQRPTLLSFRQGNETLVRALAANLGPALRTGVEVTGIKSQGEGPSAKFEITVRDGGREEAISTDHLILTTPTNVAGRLLRNMNPAFELLLSPIEYAPVGVVSLGYRRADVGHSLAGFGFLVPRSAGLSVLGTVWNSSLFPGRAPEGHVLLTSFVGGATDPNAATLPTDEIVARVHREISALLRIRQLPAFSNVEIYRRALPQYNVGHAERLAKIETLRTGFPGLWLAGNYLRGPAIGACAEQSLAVADAVVRSTQ
jgi:oxygen-dependent protoporphyrinogen oxidase